MTAMVPTWQSMMSWRCYKARLKPGGCRNFLVAVGKHFRVGQGGTSRLGKALTERTSSCCMQEMSSEESEEPSKRPRPCFYEARVGYQDSSASCHLSDTHVRLCFRDPPDAGPNPSPGCSVSRGNLNPHTAASAAAYRAATSSHQQRPQQRIAQQHPHTSSVRSRVSRRNILTQQRPQQRIAQQHPHTAASAAAYCAATSSHSSVRSSVSRSNILTQQRPQQRIGSNILTQQRPQQRISQQHPHTPASAAAYRAATSSHSSVRSSVSRSNILTQHRPQQRIVQQHSHTAAASPQHPHTAASPQHPHTAASHTSASPQHPHTVASPQHPHTATSSHQHRPQPRIAPTPFWHINENPSIRDAFGKNETLSPNQIGCWDCAYIFLANQAQFFYIFSSSPFDFFEACNKNNKQTFKHISNIYIYIYLYLNCGHPQQQIHLHTKLILLLPMRTNIWEQRYCIWFVVSRLGKNCL